MKTKNIFEPTWPFRKRLITICILLLSFGTSFASVNDIVTHALNFKAMLTTAQQSTLEQTYTNALAEHWSNLPCGAQCRNGIEFSTLTTAEIDSALVVIKSASGSTATEGYDEFIQIMTADSLLNTVNTSGAYGKGNYFLSYLNTPSDTGKWMLQYGGHHCAVNIAFNNGVVVGVTPEFKGVEPSWWTNGETKGPLQNEHDVMVVMLASLSSTQLAAAQLTTTFSDVLLGPGEDGDFPATKVGIQVSTLSTAQQSLVLEAMLPWLEDMDSSSQAIMLAIYQNELSGTYIAWTGSGTAGDSSTFLTTNTNYVRIDGPSVWIEMVCQTGVVYSTQTHYHSVWRDHTRDYGNFLANTTLSGTTVTASISSTSTLICSNGSVTLTAISGTSYQWMLNGSAISGATSQTYNTSIAGTCACVISGTTSNAIILVAGSTPVATIVSTATTICSGDSILLTASTGTGYTYQWLLNGANISGATSSTYYASVNGAFTVNITTTCSSAASNSVTITILPSPTVSISSGSTTICGGGSVVITGTTGSGYTYQWQLNGSNISGATSSAYTATSSGIYTDIATLNGCSTTSNAITLSSGITATISPSDTATITCGGSTILTANSGVGYTYQWQLNGTNIAGATSSTYTATTAGSYTVIVTSGNCSTTSSATVVTIVSSGQVFVETMGTTGNNVSITSYESSNGFVNTALIMSGSGTVSTQNPSTGYTQVNGNAASGSSHISLAPAVGTNFIISDINTIGYDSLSLSFGLDRNNGTATGSDILVQVSTDSINYTTLTFPALTNGGPGWAYRTTTGTIPKVSDLHIRFQQNGTTTTYGIDDVALSFSNSLTANITASGPTMFCNGGSVVLNSNTGSGYTYQWQLNGANISGATSSSYTANTTGSYTVIVINAVSCAATSAAMVVTVNTLPSASITAATATTFCAGNDVILNANTGTGFTYQWNLDGTAISGATSASYTASAAGSYSVVVTNSSACSASSSATVVTVNSLPAASISTSTSTTFCNGGNVVLNANTGTGFTYQWNLNGSAISGATSVSYTASTAGSYSVIVTNSSACSASSSATVVTVNSLPAASISTSTSTTFCNGGTVVLNANTGTGFTYQWNLNGSAINGATSASYTASAAGSYSVVVTNSSACSASSSPTVVTVNALPSAIVTASGATTFCNGGNVTLNANTGTGFTYQWNLNGSAINGATSASYTASAAGSYSVIVTNSSACSASSSATVVTVNALPSATVTASGATTFCNGGNVILNANTGTGFTYQWNLNGSAISGATSSSYSASAAGSYSVIVTSSSACSASSSATVITANALPSAIVTASGATTFCSGGSVVLNANTGTGFTYQWNLNGVAITGAVFASYTANASGSYTVAVTNTNGCSASSSATIVTANPLPAANAGNDVSITGGNSATLTATGGGSYVWSNGATTASITVSPSVTTDYTVTVTNGNGCSATDDVIVTVIGGTLSVTATSSLTAVCAGSAVQLTALTTGGTGNNTYTWSSNPTGFTSTIAIPTVSPSVTTIYTVTVNDGNATATATVTVNVNSLPSASITAATATTFCAGNDVILNANTGTGFTYQWNLDGAVISGATSASYTASAAGSYSVIVTNSSACSASSSATVVTVNSSPTASISASTSTIFCNGGNVVLNANTGTGFTYQWNLNGAAISGATSVSYTASTAGSYSVIVTNSSACSASSSATVVTVNSLPAASISASTSTTFCNGGTVVLNANTGTGFTYQWSLDGAAISGATSASYTASAAGSYSVIVTNSSACSASSLATVVTVNALPSAIVTASGATAFCNGGNVTLNANTGTGFTYQWNLNGAAISGAASSSYTASVAGSYNVIVTNPSACSASSTATVITVNNLPSAIVTPSTLTTFCGSGSATLNANTGTGFTYQWDLNGNPINSATTSSYIASIAGSYAVIITNSSSCSATSTAVIITINSLPSASITAATATTFCAGNDVILNANTGTGFTYQWNLDGAAISGATSASCTASAAGSYSVIVTNASACSASSSATVVTVNALPSASAGSNVTISNGSSTTLAATGGSNYIWSNGSTTASITVSPTSTTTYNVTVTNASSCSATASVIVTVNGTTLSASASALSTAVCSGTSVQLTSTASGGSGTNTFAWSSNPAGFTSSLQNPTVTPTVTTAYTVTINDGNTSANATVIITVSPLPAVSITAIGNTSFCQGDSVILNGNTSSGLTYQWQLNGSNISGATASSYTAKLAGTYSIAETNTASCVASDSESVTVNALPTASAGNDVTITAGDSTTLIATGGTGYVWNTGQQSSEIVVAPAQTTAYTVTVSNAAGCSATDQVIVTVNSALGINEISSNQLSLYPNPSNGVVNLSGEIINAGDYEITIYDVDGRMISHVSNIHTFDLSSYSAGVYNMVITNHNEFKTVKQLVLTR